MSIFLETLKFTKIRDLFITTFSTNPMNIFLRRFYRYTGERSSDILFSKFFLLIVFQQVDDRWRRDGASRVVSVLIPESKISKNIYYLFNYIIKKLQKSKSFWHMELYQWFRLLKRPSFSSSDWQLKNVFWDFNQMRRLPRVKGATRSRGKKSLGRRISLWKVPNKTMKLKFPTKHWKQLLTKRNI